MNITDFINAPDECWRDIPTTNLEASSYGKIRNVMTKAFYGEIVYLEDLHGILSGAIPVWRKGCVVMTPAPRSYFKHRSRTEKAYEDAYLYADAA